jgi:hypothetical protein
MLAKLPHLTPSLSVPTAFTAVVILGCHNISANSFGALAGRSAEDYLAAEGELSNEEQLTVQLGNILLGQKCSLIYVMDVNFTNTLHKNGS